MQTLPRFGGSAPQSILTIGIALGLFVGKPLGVVGAAFLAVKMNVAALPEGVNWKQMTGLGFLAGIEYVDVGSAV